MATYEQPEYDTPKGSAIDSILEGDEVMVFWFPSETEPGCWAFKPRWVHEDECDPEWYPTFLYGQAEDFVSFVDPWADGAVCCIGTEDELDHWLAEAQKGGQGAAAA